MEKKKNQCWDKLGEPEYGGELVIRANNKIVNFDPYYAPSGNIHSAWMERLVSDDWTLDPAVWDFRTPWHPAKYMKGQLAESWEFPEPGTHLLHLRQGIHWQNIPPANGREFTADDVVFHYNRLLGFNAFPNPSPNPVEVYFKELISVSAPDKYSVVFKSGPVISLKTCHCCGSLPSSTISPSRNTTAGHGANQPVAQLNQMRDKRLFGACQFVFRFRCWIGH